MICPECKGGVMYVNGVLVAEIRYRRCASCSKLECVEMRECSTCGGFVCEHIELEEVGA